MTPGRELRAALHTPALVWLALLGLLGVIVALGLLRPGGAWWVAQLGSVVAMVVLVLVVSMEMRRHTPIVRLFSFLGFFWVGILFAMIMVDYLTR